MNKAVMISIKPQWCERIADGSKTLEIRKTVPKIELPFKCYIYETKDKRYQDMGYCNPRTKTNFLHYPGMVIGEFICDHILGNCEMANADIAEQQGRIRREKLFEYSGGKELFGWHISNLVIYDEPKEINLFLKEDFEQIYSNWEDMFGIGVSGCGSVEYSPEPKVEDYLLKRPPQSWCYVEV